MACGILVPLPGIGPTSPTVGVQSLNHWATKEPPYLFYFSTPNWSAKTCKIGRSPYPTDQRGFVLKWPSLCLQRVPPWRMWEPWVSAPPTPPDFPVDKPPRGTWAQLNSSIFSPRRFPPHLPPATATPTERIYLIG